MPASDVSNYKSSTCTSRTKRYLSNDKNKLLFSYFIKSQFASALQGGLNKKEIQLNFLNIFSFLIFKEFHFFA